MQGPFKQQVKMYMNDLPGIVVGSILLASDQLLRMEQLAVSASSNLIWNNICINQTVSLNIVTFFTLHRIPTLSKFIWLQTLFWFNIKNIYERLRD